MVEPRLRYGSVPINSVTLELCFYRPLAIWR